MRYVFTVSDISVYPFLPYGELGIRKIYGADFPGAFSCHKLSAQSVSVAGTIYKAEGKRKISSDAAYLAWNRDFSAAFVCADMSFDECGCRFPQFVYGTVPEHPFSETAFLDVFFVV